MRGVGSCIGHRTMSDFNKLKWETSSPANAGKTSKKDVDSVEKVENNPQKPVGTLVRLLWCAAVQGIKLAVRPE